MGGRRPEADPATKRIAEAWDGGQVPKAALLLLGSHDIDGVAPGDLVACNGKHSATNDEDSHYRVVVVANAYWEPLNVARPPFDQLGSRGNSSPERSW